MSDTTIKGIVLFGAAGSGKDTFAEILAEFIPNSNMYNIGYLCRECMKITTVNEEWANKSRELATTVSDKLKSIYPDILNDYTYANAMMKDSFPIIIGGRTITDCNYWRNKGFTIVGVDVDNDIRIARLKERDADFNENSLKHKTETDIPIIIQELCDVVVLNNGDISELRESVKKFVNNTLLIKV